MIVRKIGVRLPISNEMWEDAQWWHWAYHGTTGDPRLDALLRDRLACKCHQTPKTAPRSDERLQSEELCA